MTFGPHECHSVAKRHTQCDPNFSSGGSIIRQSLSGFKRHPAWRRDLSMRTDRREN
jgi:hypothetical protein